MQIGDFIPCALIREDMRVKVTGEFRCPKEGEWYISGAIPEGYKAHANLSTPYYIGQLVRIKKVIVTKEVLL